MKTLLLAITCLLFAIPISSNADEPSAQTNTVRLTPAYISELVEVLRTNHPALRALAARQRAASHATNAVRTWEDPVATFGGSVTSDRGPSLREDGDLVYGLEQKLPLFGKAAAARRVAVAEAETESARQTMQFQLLRRDLAKQLFQTAYEEQTLALGAQDLAWLETMTATAEERYRAGTATQVEVLRLQNERAQRASLLHTEERQRDDARLAINRLLNHAFHAPLPRFTLPDAAPPVPYSSNLAALAVKFEPKLRLLDREIRSAEARVAVTRKARLPDLSAGIEGRQYSGDGGFREGLFTISFSLPWFNGGRYRSDLARERARLEAAQWDAADHALAVREEVHHLSVVIDAARRQAVLYRDEILPRSQQALTVARENWLNNRGAFNDVMESRRLLLEAQLRQARAITGQYQALGELVLNCGLDDLEALEMFNRRNEP